MPRRRRSARARRPATRSTRAGADRRPSRASWQRWRKARCMSGLRRGCSMTGTRIRKRAFWTAVALTAAQMTVNIGNTRRLRGEVRTQNSERRSKKLLAVIAARRCCSSPVPPRHRTASCARSRRGSSHRRAARWTLRRLRDHQAGGVAAAGDRRGNPRQALREQLRGPLGRHHRVS